MKTFIVLSTLAVVALAQYGSVATAADSTGTATQVVYQVPQYPINPFPGNYYYDDYEQYRPHRRHGRHGRHNRHRRPHHDWASDSESGSFEDGWDNDDFDGFYGPQPYQPYPYPFQYQRPIYTVQTTSNNAAADSTSYGTVSNTAAAAPATYGSK